MPRLIREALESSGVGGQDRVSTGVDVVGDIAIVRLASFGTREKRRIAASLMERTKNVRAVFEQEGGIEGELRLRRLRHLAGEKRTATVHRENGCAYRVDVAGCYFSPRLATERLRVARLAGPGERVLNMFAGVGPFSIPAARLSGSRVTSWEISPLACGLHEENDKLNRVGRLVKVVEGDASELSEASNARYDRILMPLPSRSNEFLPAALGVADKGATLHYYRHVLGRDEAEAEANLAEELAELLPRGAKYAARRVRFVGPRWVEMVADVKLAG